MARWTKIATAMKTGNKERQVMTMNETKLPDKQDMNEKTQGVITHSYFATSLHLSSAINTNNLHRKYTNTLLEMEVNSFFLIEQPDVTIIPALQKLDSRTLDEIMAILWNQVVTPYV